MHGLTVLGHCVEVRLQVSRQHAESNVSDHAIATNARKHRWFVYLYRAPIFWAKKISCTWAQHCSNAKQNINRAEPTLRLNQTYRITVAYGSSMHMLTIDFSLQSQPLQKLLIIGYIRGATEITNHLCKQERVFP